MNNWIKKPILRDKPQVAKLFKALEGTGAFIAGGYPRYLMSDGSKPAEDIDIFTGNWTIYQAAFEALKLNYNYKESDSLTAKFYEGITVSPNSSCTFTTSKNITLIMPIDDSVAIEIYGSTKVAGTREEILGSFDLYLSEAVIDSPETVLCSSNCEWDNDTGLMRFRLLNKPVRALKRAFKYANKGFRISETEMSKIVEAIRASSVAESSLFLDPVVTSLDF